MFPFYGFKLQVQNEKMHDLLNMALNNGGTPEDKQIRVNSFVEMAIANGSFSSFEVSIKVQEFIHARIFSDYVKMVDSKEFQEVLEGVN